MISSIKDIIYLKQKYLTDFYASLLFISLTCLYNFTDILKILDLEQYNQTVVIRFLYNIFAIVYQGKSAKSIWMAVVIITLVLLILVNQEESRSTWLEKMFWDKTFDNKYYWTFSVQMLMSNWTFLINQMIGQGWIIWYILNVMFFDNAISGVGNVILYVLNVLAFFEILILKFAINRRHSIRKYIRLEDLGKRYRIVAIGVEADWVMIIRAQKHGSQYYSLVLKDESNVEGKQMWVIDEDTKLEVVRYHFENYVQRAIAEGKRYQEN